MPLEPISATTCIIRNTGATRGRTRSVRPGATAAQQLHVGRIILNHGEPLDVDPGGHETGLVCLSGAATVTVGGTDYALTQYDALYISRARPFTIIPGTSGCDLAELSAAVEGAYPVQHVRFADVQNDPGLHFTAGGPASSRQLNILLGKNVEAGRIMAGVTFSAPGHWTSWPPHEHSVLAEEAYLYIDMPHPSFGVQFVYNDDRSPEIATMVREGDVVLMPQGYHPNVAAPGGQINFLWMMAAHRERIDRQFGVVNVHPDFADGGSGLDAGRAPTK